MNESKFFYALAVIVVMGVFVAMSVAVPQRIDGEYSIGGCGCKFAKKKCTSKPNQTCTLEPEGCPKGDGDCGKLCPTKPCIECATLKCVARTMKICVDL